VKPDKTAALLLPALSLIVILGNPGRAQDPKADAPAPASVSPEVKKAVDQLVEQFRLHPARPSNKAGEVDLYVIDARGGEATRIVGESEAWLTQSGSPVWSNDGKRILFDATPGTADFQLTRLKSIGLTSGNHLSLTDLGPGNCPDPSPDDEKIIFLLNPNAIPNARAGIWIMKADGTERTRLENYGRPRWSPDNTRIMIISFGKPSQVTMIDVRPDGKSGNLQLENRKFWSPPRWVGEGLIVATIGEEAGDSVALIDVNDPGQCLVKRVLWKKGDGGLDVLPLMSSYSPVTGRCVFVGRDGEKGLALYGLDKGGKPKRLETEGYDNLMQDPVFSPDGRYIVFSSDRPDRTKPVYPPVGRRPLGEAPVISGITVDGDLKDWPPAMERHGIKNLHIFPTTNGRGGLENAVLTTSPDLSASFSIGYDPKAQLLYLAVIVRDDKLVIGHTSPTDSDALEVYVNGSNSLETIERPQDPDWLENLDASAVHTQQYLALPDPKGPVHGITKTSGQERSPNDSLVLAFGDVKKTRTKMAYRREGDVTTYEWAIQAFDKYPDKPTLLAPGVTIGFDLVISDKDEAAKSDRAQNDPEEERAAWISWGPSVEAGQLKVFNPTKTGEIVLGRPATP